MGKLEVRGSATRMVDFDRMEIHLDFHAKEETAAEASEKVMQECEEFLGVLKKGGFDISGIALEKDTVDDSTWYLGNGEREDGYTANRVLKIESAFNMKLINDIRAITQSRNDRVKFRVNFSLSNEDEIRQALSMEALKEAKKQAESMAQAIDQKVVGLISADRNAPKIQELEADTLGEVLCIDLCCDEEIEAYENSDELSASGMEYTETIYTSWEIE